jgi:uncharacterized alpha-E superfamily protein
MMDTGMLSRVADSLYWMARYLERAEHTARILAVKLEAILDQTPEDAAQSWLRVSGALAWPMTPLADSQRAGLARTFTLDRAHPSSIVTSIRLARDNARQVREMISTEMWAQLNRLYLRVNAATFEHDWNRQQVAVLRSLCDEMLLFAGITDSTMRHGEGWHFIQLATSSARSSSAVCSTCISAPCPLMCPRTCGRRNMPTGSRC